MRHHNTKRKFGREKNQRNALINSLALNLIVREKIKTTEPKAKELRPFIEKIITRAKKNDVASRRLVISKLSNRKKEVKKVFDKIAPKYMDKNGGYTRILKTGTRLGDNAEMCMVELVDYNENLLAAKSEKAGKSTRRKRATKKKTDVEPAAVKEVVTSKEEINVVEDVKEEVINDNNVIETTEPEVENNKE